MNTRRAFTMLELLITFLVIATILSILYPALRGGHRAGLRSKCLNNLRQLQLAQLSYAMDHNGSLVEMGLPHGGLPSEDVAWINTLQEYYDSELIVRSPLDRSVHWPSEDGGEGVPVPGTTDHFRRTSYGGNNYLDRKYSPLAAINPLQVTDRLSKVQNHVNTVHFLIMAFGGEYAGADHVHVEEWHLPFDPDLAPIQAGTHSQTNAVRGKEKSWDAVSNYSFLDGHVESLMFGEVYRDLEVNRFDPTVSRFFATQYGLFD